MAVKVFFYVVLFEKLKHAWDKFYNSKINKICHFIENKLYLIFIVKIINDNYINLNLIC